MTTFTPDLMAGTPEGLALKARRFSIPAAACFGDAARVVFGVFVLADTLASLFSLLRFNALQSPSGLINRRFRAVPVHSGEPGENFIAIEPQQLASLEMRHTLDHVDGMWSRYSGTRCSPPTASRSALRAVTRSLINP